MFEIPEGSADQLYAVSLPARVCLACDAAIPRRANRVVIRASWRPGPETLCVRCWLTICSWAARFANKQGVLDF